MNKEDYFKYYIQGSDHYLIPKDVFNELFDEMVNWREEIKELNQKYLNAVADYETTMSELQELKKQLEETKTNYEQEKYIVDKQTRQLTDEYKNTEHQTNKVEELKNQQKEFIEWLEAMSIMYENEYKDIDVAEHYNCVLQKYKSIIGDDK